MKTASPRHRTLPALCAVFALLVWLAASAADTPRAISFTLQNRDAATAGLKTRTEHLDPARVGIVIIDMWNWHWCKTSSARVGALVPRMNASLEAARKLGMTVFWCPTDVADNYTGTPAREKMLALDTLPLPLVHTLSCPTAKDGGGCTCGYERCRVNYGWDSMNPRLRIEPPDLMPNDPRELYTVCKQRGITHLVYMGVHSQVCVLGKSVGLKAMLQAGLNCYLARDLTDAHGKYDPKEGITPDGFTRDVVAHFEQYLCSTVNFAEEMQRAGTWGATGPVDPVRMAPWGKVVRPHHFEQELIVTLSAPWQPKAEIHYTTDGSEPTPDSPLYKEPLRLAATTLVKSAAFEQRKLVALVSEGYFTRQPPLPAPPDVSIAELKPVRSAGPRGKVRSGQPTLSNLHEPQVNRSNRGSTLKIREQAYTDGMGVHAPNQLMYAVKTEYNRFVALAGIDDQLLEVDNAADGANRPSVIFKVFIDGNLAAESPVMKISEPPWRFNLKIPAGSRFINLVATDAGDGNREDVADWVNAGFLTHEPPNQSDLK